MEHDTGRHFGLNEIQLLGLAIHFVVLLIIRYMRYALRHLTHASRQDWLSTYLLQSRDLSFESGYLLILISFVLIHLIAINLMVSLEFNNSLLSFFQSSTIILFRCNKHLVLLTQLSNQIFLASDLLFKHWDVGYECFNFTSLLLLMHLKNKLVVSTGIL